MYIIILESEPSSLLQATWCQSVQSVIDELETLGCSLLDGFVCGFPFVCEGAVDTSLTSIDEAILRDESVTEAAQLMGCRIAGWACHGYGGIASDVCTKDDWLGPVFVPRWLDQIHNLVLVPWFVYVYEVAGWKLD